MIIHYLSLVPQTEDRHSVPPPTARSINTLSINYPSIIAIITPEIQPSPNAAAPSATGAGVLV